MINFWQRLEKPFTVLAPMDDVTDASFRQMFTILPRPDVLFTEFTNADGLFYDKKGTVLKKLRFEPSDHPIVAQIWGTNPDTVALATKKIEELGFDGIDINMGCPVKDVVKHGAGAAMIKTPDLAKQIIEAARCGLPLSVKTRLGYDKIITNEWISFLLEQKLAALTIHGRIAKQMSAGEANWEEIGKTVVLRNQIFPDTIIIGNGDVQSYAQVIEKHEKYGVDGIMVGRGVFANPWVFEKKEKSHTKKDRIKMAKKHVEIFEKVWCQTKDFNILKKFFKMYIRDFDGASELRQKLMESKNSSEVKDILASQDLSF